MNEVDSDGYVNWLVGKSQIHMNHMALKVIKSSATTSEVSGYENPPLPGRQRASVGNLGNKEKNIFFGLFSEGFPHIFFGLSTSM